jgi:hypothetical protein
MPFRISIYTQPSTANALRLYFWTISSGKRDNNMFIHSIVLDVHHHHAGVVLGGEGDVNDDIECCDVGRGSGNVAGVVEYVAAAGQPDSFFFFLVRFVITDYFAVSDIYVFWDVGKFDKETFVSGMSKMPWKRCPYLFPNPRVQSGSRRGSFISAMYSIYFPVNA